MDELFGNQIKQIHLIFCTKSVDVCIYKILLTDDRLSSYSLNFLQPLK